MKKRVLFVGENPLGTSGCSNMLAAMLKSLDMDKYDPAGFVVNNVNPTSILFDPTPYTMVQGSTQEDRWGLRTLVSLIQETDFDHLCMVGVDLWRYFPAWDVIRQLRDVKKFKWIGIFPYDLWKIQKSWIEPLNDLDLPYVYSKYGFTALKQYVPKLRYYQPELNGCEDFKPGDKTKARSEVFPNIPIDKVIFGFIGQNQIRKSPERLVKAFFEAKKTTPNIVLYLHTDIQSLYNLKQIAQDCGAVEGDIVSKQQGVSYARNKMPLVYNALDCVVNCSMQEGLSLTPIEAMACGVPVIASDTTAQTELLKGGGVVIVPCNELAFVPMGNFGESITVESRACSVDMIAEAIVEIAESKELRASMQGKALRQARAWLTKTDSINDLLADAGKKPKVSEKIKAVLFAQHSAAGDVLMTTQCFKGIKERHPDMPLVYMTQKFFGGIVEGNPYIDEIIEWDERQFKRYEVVYNPHGEHILHGGFNNLDVTLHSMYPYFTGVEADEMFIDPVITEVVAPAEYIVVHTTGGSQKYRSYPHMDTVLKNIGIPIVQLGGPSDLRCKSDLDLCGKLTWRESAWMMKHAKAAVVIDSFMSHLAGTIGTDAVVLYGPAPPRVVQPKAQGCEIVNLKPDMLKVCKNMSHCWGRQPQCNSPCINTISPIVVRKALEGLL